MSALAIWDPAAKQLFSHATASAKNRFITLCVMVASYFASELKGLLAHPDFQKGLDIDPRALSDYLSFGYILTPKSFYRNIHRLPAAHFALFALDTGELRTREYWRLEDFFCPRLPNDASTRTAFGDLLDDAVRLRLRADVPVAMSLSGGIDSAAVLEFGGSTVDKNVTSYSVGFDEPSFDESEQARETANFLDIPFEKLNNTNISKIRSRGIRTHSDC